MYRLNATLLTLLLIYCMSTAGTIMSPVRESTARITPPVRSGDKVDFIDNKLYVDGKPFFIFATVEIVDSLESMKEHHFNTVFFWRASDAAAAMDNASKVGLKVIPYLPMDEIPGQSLTEEELRNFIMTMKDNPALLAWNIGDDMSSLHVEKASEVNEIMKSLDASHPTMLDGTPVEAFIGIADMYCRYTYPLLKQSLDWYGDLLETVQERDPDKYLWTWVQAHPQSWYREEVLGGNETSAFPDPEQFRLLMYTAISQGFRGIILYTGRFFRDDWYGGDRYAEAGILGSEIEIVGSFIAGGEFTGSLETNRSDVKAASFSYQGSTLVILTVSRPDYTFCVDEGVVEGVEVELPVQQPGPVFAISFPEVRRFNSEQRNDKIVVSLPRVELTDLILVPSDEALVSTVEDTMDELLSDVARFSVEHLEKKGVKVEVTWRELTKLGHNVEGAEQIVYGARDRLTEAKDHLQMGRYRDAYIASREGQFLYRTLAYKYWQQATLKYGTPTREGMDRFRLTYYDLPKYYLKKSWVEQKGIEAGIKLIAILLLIILPLILWKIRKRAKRLRAVTWLSSHFTYPV